jgi:hypothetical protein
MLAALTASAVCLLLLRCGFLRVLLAVLVVVVVVLCVG